MKTKRVKIVHCKDVAKHLCENLDHQLNSLMCREIKKHLQECPNCTAYLDSLKKTISLYQSVSTPHLSSSVHKKLCAVLKLKP
jgi:predicted anti-sigma-YlaC factor YlaD